MKQLELLRILPICGRKSGEIDRKETKNTTDSVILQVERKCCSCHYMVYDGNSQGLRFAD